MGWSFRMSIVSFLRVSSSQAVRPVVFHSHNLLVSQSLLATAHIWNISFLCIVPLFLILSLLVLLAFKIILLKWNLRRRFIILIFKNFLWAVVNNFLWGVVKQSFKLPGLEWTLDVIFYPNRIWFLFLNFILCVDFLIIMLLMFRQLV